MGFIRMFVSAGDNKTAVRTRNKLNYFLLGLLKLKQSNEFYLELAANFYSQNVGTVKYWPEDHREFIEYLHKKPKRLHFERQPSTGMGHPECKGNCGTSIGPATGRSKDYFCRKRA